jgi:hypothetical protein
MRALLYILSALFLFAGCTRSSDFVMDKPVPPGQKVSAGIIEGQVVNAAGGLGLERVQITLTSFENGPFRVSVLTDSGGRFNVPGLRPGEYLASFSRVDLGPHADVRLTVVSDRRTYYQTTMGVLPGRLEGTVTNAVGGAVLPGVRIDLSNGMVAYTDTNGHYAIENLPGGFYAADFSLNGFLRLVGQRASIQGGQTTVLNVQLSQDLGTLVGHVSNALNGLPLYGVRVSIRTGPGAPLLSDTYTDGSGNYILRGLNGGSYTVDFELSGFVPLFNVPTTITVGASNVLDAVLTPVLAEDQFRIVMSWTREKPGAVRDVDTYMTIPGVATPIYFSNRDSGDGANLDVDDTTWQGPETVTITSLRQGTYRYYVDNYNMRCQPSYLGNSEIVVQVYKGSSLLKTYNVPQGNGLRYEVLNIVNGAVVDIGRFDDSLWVEGAANCSPPKPESIRNQSFSPAVMFINK